jgi:ATP-binding protein involved in chromosome partitioning
MIDRQTITHALSDVADAGGNGNIVTNNRVQRVDIDGGVVKITLVLPTIDRDEKLRIEDACFDAVSALEGVKDVSVITVRPQQPHTPVKPQAPTAGRAPATKGGSPFDQQASIPGVRHIIAVASGKGGVGKSTVCVNLALALVKRGARVGLLDADIYGPSLHVLLGVTDRPRAGKTKEIHPVEKDGLKLMSLGFLTDDNTPLIWRGPIVTGVIRKFLLDVEWGDLDYLMIDMPPGTGDAQLTLTQTVPITGAIIVTTPSHLALIDAEKGLRMFKQVNAPVLGIVENMSTFVCPHCGKKTDIFDKGGGAKLSKSTSAEILGEIPIDPAVRAGGDRGDPIVKSDAASPVAKAFFAVADKILERFPVASR